MITSMRRRGFFGWLSGLASAVFGTGTGDAADIHIPSCTGSVDYWSAFLEQEPPRPSLIDEQRLDHEHANTKTIALFDCTPSSLRMNAQGHVITIVDSSVRDG